MNDSVLVRSFKGLTNLPRDIESVPYGQAALLQPFCQRLSFNELEDQTLRAFEFHEVIDRCNVGVIQGCQQLRFPLGTTDTFSVLRKLVRQHLDCDIATQFYVACPINVSHAARSEERDNL